MSDISDLVNRIIADGKITEAEHEKFKAAVNEDGKMDDEEKEQVWRIINMIDEGKLKVK